MHLNHIEAERLLPAAPAWVRSRFESKIDRNGPVPSHASELGPCWIWIGEVGDTGYGRFRFKRQRIRAHRAALIFAGVNPGDRRALHRCDVRRCVRPDHLFAGTMAENSKDAKIKGRMRRPSWKLDAAIAAQIRSAAEEGEPTAALARRYGVRREAINDVIRRRTWTESL